MCRVEKRGEVRKVGGGFGTLGCDDFATIKQEGSWHLASVTREVTHPAAFEKGNQSQPKYFRARQFEQPALAEAKRTIELAVRIRDAGDLAVCGEVLNFVACFQHVNEHQFRIPRAGPLVGILQSPENLAGEGATEVAEENQHQLLVCRCLRESRPAGEPELSYGRNQPGTIAQCWLIRLGCR